MQPYELEGQCPQDDFTPSKLFKPWFCIRLTIRQPGRLWRQKSCEDSIPSQDFCSIEFRPPDASILQTISILAPLSFSRSLIAILNALSWFKQISAARFPSSGSVIT